MDMRRVWNQEKVPVIIRREGRGQQHRLRLPLDQSNRSWLRNERRSSPAWIASSRYWEIPKSWFNDFVERALNRYGSVWVIQPFRQLEVCAPACWNARGHECQCSCMGANHSMGHNGNWIEISEAFAVRWNDGDWACRLLTAK